MSTLQHRQHTAGALAHQTPRTCSSTAAPDVGTAAGDVDSTRGGAYDRGCTDGPVDCDSTDSCSRWPAPTPGAVTHSSSWWGDRKVQFTRSNREAPEPNHAASTNDSGETGPKLAPEMCSTSPPSVDSEDSAATPSSGATSVPFRSCTSTISMVARAGGLAAHSTPHAKGDGDKHAVEHETHRHSTPQPQRTHTCTT